MSPRSKNRFTPPLRPFYVSVLDDAGPTWMRTTKGRGQKAYQGYVVVFVCLFTRAVHLEACSDYMAEGFIAAYKRFTSHRSIRHTLHSNCGTNFVGAERQLRELHSEASAVLVTIALYLADNGTR